MGIIIIDERTVLVPFLDYERVLKHILISPKFGVSYYILSGFKNKNVLFNSYNLLRESKHILKLYT